MNIFIPWNYSTAILCEFISTYSLLRNSLLRVFWIYNLNPKLFRLDTYISVKILFNNFITVDLRIKFLCNFKNNPHFSYGITKNIEEKEDFNIVFCIH